MLSQDTTKTKFYVKSAGMILKYTVNNYVEADECVGKLRK